MNQTKKILLLDDEATTLIVLESMLKRIAEKHGLTFDISSSSDPVHVLYDLVHQKKDDFDLILMDVRMPKVCGEEIYRSMQMMGSDSLDRLVFVTAYSNDLLASIFGVPLKVLRKPFQVEALERVVATMFGLEGAVAEKDAWEVLENPPC